MFHFNKIDAQPAPAKVNEALLTLKPNQLLIAKILDIFPDQSARVLYNGHIFQARLEAPLTKGNRYLFEVNVNKETFVLKKIDTDHAKSTNEQILDKWNLPKSELLNRAVELSHSEKIPLTKDSIKLVAEVLQQTSSIPLKHTIEAIKQILQLNLDAHPSTVRAVIASLQKQSGFSEFEDLYRSLLPIQEKHPSIAKAVAVLRDIFGYEEHARQTDGNDQKFKAATAKEASDQGLLPAKQNSLDSKGMQQELKRAITVDSHLDSEVTVKQAASPSDMDRTKTSTDFLATVQKWLKGSGLNHEKNILHDPILLNKSDSVKSMLLHLQKNAEMMNLPDTIQQKVETALTKMTSLQLQNINLAEGMQQFTMQIPLGQEQLPKEITIRWEGKKKKGEPLDADHCRMLFWLEMKNLKEIAVDVQIQNRIVSLKVYSEHPLIQKLGTSFIATLKKQLQEMNYKLSSVQFAQKQTGDIKMPESTTSYKGMDLRI
jgi:hypothetical protein